MKEKVVKFTLAGYNLMLLLSAIVLGIFGGYTIYIYHNYFYLINYNFYLIGILTLLSCVVTGVVVFFGCSGTLSSSSCITITFSVLLGILFLLELCLGISGFFIKSDMHSVNSRNFIESLRMYKAQVGMSEKWDNVQINWDCCGADYYKDWKSVFENGKLPISCCRTDGNAGDITCTQDSIELRRQGCINYFGKHLEDIVTVTASVGVGFAILQIIGIGLSCYAAKIFRRFAVYR